MKTRDTTTAFVAKDTNTLITVSEVAERVGREILESSLEPGAWATALYECEGRREDALAVYTRLRVRQLMKQRRVRLAKVSMFESRRLMICMGDQVTRDSIARTIQEMLGNPTRGKSINFVKPKLSFIWMSILFFGAAGTASSLGRLFSNLLPDSIRYPLTLVALLVGVGAVWGAMALRHYLPKRWIMLGWNSCLVLTCNVLCLTSLLLGAKVIKHSGSSPASFVSPVHAVVSAPLAVRVKSAQKPSPAAIAIPLAKETTAQN
jgi:hypothetical protein